MVYHLYKLCKIYLQNDSLIFKWPSHLGATSAFGLKNEIALSVIV